MSAAPKNLLRMALDEVLNVLSRYGKVDIRANVGGRDFSISIDSEGSAPRRSALRASAGRGGRRAGGASASEDSAGSSSRGGPTAEQVLAKLEEDNHGMGLGQLSKAMRIRPRTRLKGAISELIKAGRIKKVGRNFRSTALPSPRPGRPTHATTVAAAQTGRRPGRPAGAKKAAKAAGRRSVA